MSFYHYSYCELINTLLKAQFELVTVKDFLLSTKKSKKAILRHDVDRLANKALDLAMLEHHSNIRSTYYFRCNKQGKFPEKIIREIKGLSHEIGYHYETLSQQQGDSERAVKQFCHNLNNLRQIAECETISMHGAPLSKYDNQLLVEYLDFDKLGILGDAVKDITEFKPYYLTDTGGGWQTGEHINFRDHLGLSLPEDALPNKAEQFFEFIKPIDLIYISTHPERWSNNIMGFTKSFAKDKMLNACKRALKFVRANH